MKASPQAPLLAYRTAFTRANAHACALASRDRRRHPPGGLRPRGRRRAITIFCMTRAGGCGGPPAEGLHHQGHRQRRVRLRAGQGGNEAPNERLYWRGLGMHYPSGWVPRHAEPDSACQEIPNVPQEQRRRYFEAERPKHSERRRRDRTAAHPLRAVVGNQPVDRFPMSHGDARSHGSGNCTTSGTALRPRYRRP